MVAVAFERLSVIAYGEDGKPSLRRSTWEMEPSDRSRLDSRVPRKEVIQPHLPVRLPCYDFTPITDPTLDACLSGKPELAQRLQVSPTFVV